jgi:ADP-heptose:LPS heptosyltransferase
MNFKGSDAVLQHLQRSSHGLLVQMAGMGDLIMALPAITSLKMSLPGMKWTLLTRSAHAELLQDWMDTVVGLPWPPRISNAATILNGLIRLRRRRFDCAIHLYGIASFRGALAMKALFHGIAPTMSIGRSGPYANGLYDVGWEETHIPSKHEVDLNLAMIESLGVSRMIDVPTLSANDANIRRVSMMLRDFPGANRFAVIFPGGVRATRHWPVENYACIARRLCSLGIGVCVVGGEAERNDSQRIAEAAGDHGYNLSGRLSLQDLAALLSLASVYLGNDSGPTHLAAALGTPCIAMFGPGDVNWISPRGRRRIRVLRHKMWCSPCYLERCSHHTCMRSLAVDEVYQVVMEFLDVASDLVPGRKVEREQFIRTRIL